MCWKYSHEFFCYAIKELVPERIDEIDKHLISHRVKFRAIKDSDRVRFCVHPNGEIEIYTKALTRLWAHTYAYFALYDYIENVGWQRNIDFTRNKNAAEAADLLKWAVTRDIETCCEYVNLNMASSADCNIPIEPFSVKSGSDLSVSARDIAVFAIGHVLLHEIAHLELRHDFDLDLDRDIAIHQEYEADMWAAHFVMDKMEHYIGNKYGGEAVVSKVVFKKRLLSIVACGAWLVKTECYFGASQEQSHPPMFERLGKIIGEFVSDENHLAWAMTVVVLTLHLQPDYLGMIFEKKFRTFKECAQHYMDLISKRR